MLVAPLVGHATRGFIEPGTDGACTTDADCEAGFSCFDGGRCLCSAGTHLCGVECTNLAEDARSCGACWRECAADEICSNGGCVAPLTYSPAGDQSLTPADVAVTAVVGSPFRMSGYDTQTTCRLDAEAYPERAAVAGDAHFFVVYNGYGINWAHAYSTWNPAESTGVPGEGGTARLGDPSATTSDYTGLNYVSLMAARPGDTNNCVGVAAISSDRIDTNDWSQYGGLRCISPGDPGGTDGTMIEYDIAGTDLWSVDWDITYSQARFQIMKNCRAGAPGCCVDASCTATCSESATERCPVTWTAATASFVRGHPSVAVNPCTHNGVMVYENTTNEVRLQVRKPAGTFVKDIAIATGQPSTNNNCPCTGDVRACVDTFGNDCGPNCAGGQGCMTRVRRPQVATVVNQGSCYAYVTWEFTATASDSNVYWNDALAIWNITNDASPTAVRTYTGKATSGAWNHYGSQLAVSGPNVAWMRFSDIGGPCNVSFFAHGDTNGAFSSMSDWGAIASGFPAIRTPQGSRGWLDWTSTISRGVGVGGELFGTWTQPVCMTSNFGSCPTCSLSGCSSGRWSFEIRGVKITP